MHGYQLKDMGVDQTKCIAHIHGTQVVGKRTGEQIRTRKQEQHSSASRLEAIAPY